MNSFKLFFLLIVFGSSCSCKIDVLSNDLDLIKELSKAGSVSINYDNKDTFVSIYDSKLDKYQKKYFTPVLAVFVDDFMSKYRTEKVDGGKVFFDYFDSKSFKELEESISDYDIARARLLIEKTKNIFLDLKEGKVIKEYFSDYYKIENINFCKENFSNSIGLDFYGLSFDKEKEDTIDVYVVVYNQDNKSNYFVLSFNSIEGKVKSVGKIDK
ncbi:hypothetical protein SAMN04489761_2263 [Tenacibaculum sp. MAR_2009_124]|uniref:hypothetical protein n=1 Tax=Tenacibaculum sp. MAR_2009_124 TaxID=1250059 RepID=UPI00089852A9|nr:hypothetical protein [Tenacibaculum sp. MAR_2009_124]SEC01784.1 hypothetical protein SAMN04489761_2263 [Tenacibaculum sp. MAR_2009_124]